MVQSTPDRLMAKLTAKMDEEMGSSRHDLYISDFKPISRNAVKFLLGYSEKDGKIGLKEVGEYIMAKFEGVLIPQPETARLHREGAISIVATIHRITRPFTDSKKMMTITAASFMDVNMRQMWKVCEDNDGTKYLMLTSDEDVDSILKKQSANISKGQLRFTNITAGIANIKVGDMVKAFVDDKLCSGKVENISPDTTVVTINCNGKSIKIPRESVVEVVELGRQHKAELAKTINQYYSEAFGSKPYADKMTQILKTNI